MRYAIMAAAIGLAACSASAPRHVSMPPSEIRTVYTFQNARGVTRDIETTRTTFERAAIVPGDWERVWLALPDVYASLGIVDSEVLNEDEHLFGRRYLQVRMNLGENRLSRIIRCGSLSPSAESVNPVTLTVMTVVEPVPGGSRVSSWVDATSRDVAGTSSAPVQCGSTGWLENEIVEALMPGQMAGK